MAKDNESQEEEGFFEGLSELVMGELDTPPEFVDPEDYKPKVFLFKPRHMFVALLFVALLVLLIGIGWIAFRRMLDQRFINNLGRTLPQALMGLAGLTHEARLAVSDFRDNPELMRQFTGVVARSASEASGSDDAFASAMTRNVMAAGTDEALAGLENFKGFKPNIQYNASQN